MENRDIFIDSYFLTGRGKKNLVHKKKGVFIKRFFLEVVGGIFYIL